MQEGNPQVVVSKFAFFGCGRCGYTFSMPSIGSCAPNMICPSCVGEDGKSRSVLTSLNEAAKQLANFPLISPPEFDYGAPVLARCPSCEVECPRTSNRPRGMLNLYECPDHGGFAA